MNVVNLHAGNGEEEEDVEVEEEEEDDEELYELAPVSDKEASDVSSEVERNQEEEQAEMNGAQENNALSCEQALIEEIRFPADIILFSLLYYDNKPLCSLCSFYLLIFPGKVSLALVWS